MLLVRGGQQRGRVRPVAILDLPLGLSDLAVELLRRMVKVQAVKLPPG